MIAAPPAGLEPATCRVRESIATTGDSPLSIVTPETLPDLRERVRSTTPSDRTLSQYRDGARINRHLVVCDHLTPSNSGNTFPQVIPEGAGPVKTNFCVVLVCS